MARITRTGRTVGPRAFALGLAAVLVAGLLAACQTDPAAEGDDTGGGTTPSTGSARGEDDAPAGPITLAFGGDVHFEGGVATLLDDPDATLGPLSRGLRTADLAMVNLETALTTRGQPAAKELEVPDNRFWFRAPPAALDVLRRSGVDAVSVANNHGADYGVTGVRDAVRTKRQEAARDDGVAVLGVGTTPAEAFTPARFTVRGTEVAVLAADDSPLESDDPTWQVAAGTGPGLASARDDRRLVAAVRRAAEDADVVVVYLHWGAEYEACATTGQRDLARDLARAGADVVVGSHAHVQVGAGVLSGPGGGTYVDYGLGNLLWYHGRLPDTGVLRLRVEDGEVVRDQWVPGTIPLDGGPPTLATGADRRTAMSQWRSLRRCAGLAPVPGAPDGPGPVPPDGDLLAYTSSVTALPAAQRRRMIGRSHRAGCPVALSDLRLLSVRHVGFDGEAHTGRMVVAARWADDLAGVFDDLYTARYPIRRMQPVDAYGGDDDRSMAADNSSSYNCRTVAGQTTLSDHAYGAAVDLNPVENPYVTSAGVAPPAGERYADLDRDSGTREPAGVIVADDAVVRAFASIGWTWGGTWTEPDYQHFAAP